MASSKKTASTTSSSAKASSASKRAEKVKKLKSFPLLFFLGDLMTSNFFNRNKFTIFIVVALLMLYISIKYKCQTRMETISALETELAIVKSESIREQGKYKSNTRESKMQELVESMELDLKVQQQPPYQLSY